jgi:hypothetical protein
MNYQTVRELFPCPDCGVDAREYCISRQGTAMGRFIHPNRSRAIKTTLEETLKLRDWLRQHSVIFQVTE